MKTIIFIGTQKSGSSREAIKAAEGLGYFTVLLTSSTAFINNREEFPDVHLMKLCNLSNIDEIRKTINDIQLKSLSVAAIVSFVDPYCETACLLADELGINYFSTEAISNMLNKIRSREILSNTCYVPYYTTLGESSSIDRHTIENHLPIIIKAPNSTGSKDVFKVNSYKEFKNYKNKLFRKYPDDPILIEEFLDGPQYLVETVVYHGKLHIIAIFQQEITFTGRFIVTGYNLVLDPIEEFLTKLTTAVQDIVKAHGLTHGSCHLELRYIRDNWKLIEINPRISGGAMNKLIETGLGINLVEQILKMALDCKPNLEPKFKKHAFCQHIIVSDTGILEKVTGRNKALKSKGVQCVYIKPKRGAYLTPPQSMGNRYAYVIATGDTEEEARDNAKQAAALIKFSLKPAELPSELLLDQEDAYLEYNAEDSVEKNTIGSIEKTERRKLLSR